MDGLGSEDPHRIGEYRLLSRLGAGGMGRVYLARSERGRTVAVKLVQRELAQQPEFRRRFRQEVEAARRVGGDWTAPVLDADTDADTPWVATGYIAGPSLHSAVARDHGPLPGRSVRILAAGLVRALRDIHGAGLIHRDLKPSNILITIDGPRVIDFGIARALETITDGMLTRTGAVVGSPGFMSPEQVRGERVTPASDVFCLGAVLAFAATGRTPFGTADSGVHALMYRIAQEAPDLEGLPEELRELVEACLTKDPDERPTVEDLLERTEADAALLTDDSDQPWLPGSLVAQLGRHAVQLLDSEEPLTDGLPVAGPPAKPAAPPRPTGTPPPAMPAEPPAPPPPTVPAPPAAPPVAEQSVAEQPEPAPAPEAPPAAPSTPTAPLTQPAAQIPAAHQAPAPPQTPQGPQEPLAPQASQGPQTPVPAPAPTPTPVMGPAAVHTPPTPYQSLPPVAGAFGSAPRMDGQGKPKRNLLVVLAVVVAIAVVSAAVVLAVQLGGNKDKGEQAKESKQPTGSTETTEPPEETTDPAEGDNVDSPGTSPGAPTVAGDVPANYLGAWEGEIIDSSGEEAGIFRRIEIRQGLQGSAVATTVNMGPRALCVGEATLVSFDALMVITSEVTKSVPEDECSSYDEQTLKLQPNGTLVWTYENSGLTATLTRAASGPEPIPAAYLGTWQGTVPASEDGSLPATDYEITVEQGPVGTVVSTWTGDSNSYHCEWDSTLVSVGENRMLLGVGEVTKSAPADACKDGETYGLVMEVKSADKLSVRSAVDGTTPITYTRVS